GLFEKAQLWPAFAAQRAGLGHQPLAPRADRRKQHPPGPLRRSGDQALELNRRFSHETSHPAVTIYRTDKGVPMEPVFDIESLLARKRRAARIADEGAAFLMERAAEDLADRLSAVERRFEKGAALFSTTDAAARVMAQSGKVASVARVEVDAGLTDFDGITAVPETVPFEPESIDLAVSLYALHEMNDVPGMLVQIRRALRPDGLFLGCMAGNGTLAELREALLAAETELYGGASPRVFPFTDVRDAGGLLQRAGLALPVADLETVTVRYDSLFGLIRELRALGAT